MIYSRIPNVQVSLFTMFSPNILLKYRVAVLLLLLLLLRQHLRKEMDANFSNQQSPACPELTFFSIEAGMHFERSWYIFGCPGET